MKSNPHFRLFPFLFLAVACAGPRGEIMDDTEQDYVDLDSAGAATFDRLTAAVDKLFTSYRDKYGRGKKVIKVALTDVVNRSDEPLGASREQLFDVIATKINAFPEFTTLSPTFVGAVLRRTRMTSEDLFFPDKRREFLRVLEQEGQPVDCVLMASLTTMSTKASKDIRQVNYRMTMDLVDVVSGQNMMESQLVRKRFSK